MKLLKQAYYRVNDWQALAKLLPQLKKQKVVPDDQLRQLELQSFEALFEQAYSNGRGLSTLDERIRPATKIWNDLSSAQRRDPVMIHRFAQCLTQLGAEEKAAILLRENLTRNYSADLIQLYGKIRDKDIGKQLLFAESLLNERPNDADLLLTLGRLALRNELWGKAREYFEASLRLSRRIDTYNELGRLLAHLDDHENSTRYFQEGLLLAADTVVDLPMPAKPMQTGRL